MAFLAFEGIDGAGKSSLINGLETYLMRKSIKVVISREPGGTPLGEELREILLRTQGANPLPKCEALLYQAIRAQHVEEKIKPSLKEGYWFLCDRFTASSLAFQSGGRDISQEDIEWLNTFSTSDLKPDLNILLNISVDTANERMEKRYTQNRQDKDRFELEKKDFHRRVRERYLEITEKEKGQWLILDANKATQDLLQELIKELEKRECL